MSTLVLRAVTLRIDGTVVLTDLDWSVEPDQRWVVVGPNGAGKTALLQVAALLRHPSSGTVEVLGEHLGRCDVRELRRRIALSSPAMADALEARMTVREVLLAARHGDLAPWWHRADASDHRRAEELLARFDLHHRADHGWPTLSAGERQRALLARALVNDPELLLFDEPTAGLDLAARELLLEDLDRIAADPASPPQVVVTHHLEEVPPATTHVLVLRGGRPVAQGPVAETLVDATLSEAFASPLTVWRADDGRWHARRDSAGADVRRSGALRRR